MWFLCLTYFCCCWYFFSCLVDRHVKTNKHTLVRDHFDFAILKLIWFTECKESIIHTTIWMWFLCFRAEASYLAFFTVNPSSTIKSAYGFFNCDITIHKCFVWKLLKPFTLKYSYKHCLKQQTCKTTSQLVWLTNKLFAKQIYKSCIWQSWGWLLACQKTCIMGWALAQ